MKYIELAGLILLTILAIPYIIAIWLVEKIYHIGLLPLLGLSSLWISFKKARMKE